MPESTVQVASGGAGPKLHTWQRTIGANNVEDEGVFPAEFPYASYFINASGISTATSAAHVLQIMAGASNNLRIRRIRVEQRASATAVNLMAFTIARLTTAGTGGGVVTPRPFDNVSAPGCTAMTLPTVLGTVGVTLMTTVLVLRQAVSATQTQPEELFEWTQHPGTQPIIIPAGTSNGIAIILGTGVAGATVDCNVELVETAFAG